MVTELWMHDEMVRIDFSVAAGAVRRKDAI